MIALAAPRDHDARAWRDLRDRLRPFVARRVRAEDVDDVVQEILLRVHRGAAGVRDDERFAAWLFQVARSVIADHGRAKARAARDAIDDDDPIDGGDDDASARLAAVLAFFVARLPSPYREAIALTELEGKTQREAAAMLGVSLPALKSQVLRGRARLRELLERCCEIAVDARGKPIECTPRAQPCGCAHATS